MLVESFLKNSWQTVKVLVNKLQSTTFEKKKTVSLFKFKDGQRICSTFEGKHFFLRGSVEYTNPQLTIEEVQGILGTRLLEVCSNYFYTYGLRQPTLDDENQICEILSKPVDGVVVGFLLNTDDVEADRYSMNPLKSSIVNSGQSAFPAASVTTDSLAVDESFVSKYEGTLISRGEVELISRHLKSSGPSYLDMIDAVKYEQLAKLSETFGIDLTLYSLRMPLATLKSEKKDGLLHYLISKAHKDYESVQQLYTCMGRSMSKRTTLLTVPHSQKGYGSKRAARGRMYFTDSQFEKINVKYKDTKLYPNAIDPNDVSIAKAEDEFDVPMEKLADYSFVETPSSPQFFLYSLGSPEDAAVWHGVGAFASPQLLQSYTAIRGICAKGELMHDIQEKFGVKAEVPLQFNLAPTGMWGHPVHHNIDASIGCVEKPADLARLGMKLEYLSKFK